MKSGTRTSTSTRARLTTRGLIWRSRPTSFQAWLRVSNIFGGVLGIGMASHDGDHPGDFPVDARPALHYPSLAMNSNARKLVIPAVILGSC